MDEGFFMNAAVNGRHYCNIRLGDYTDPAETIREKADILGSAILKAFPNDSVRLTCTRWVKEGYNFPIAITGN